MIIFWVFVAAVGLLLVVWAVIWVILAIFEDGFDEFGDPC